MKKITVNGKEYTLKTIDFSAICDLESLGLDISSAHKQTFTTLRALLAHAMGVDMEVASQEIQKHIVGGGKLDDLKPLFDNLVESDFFRHISQ